MRNDPGCRLAALLLACILVCLTFVSCGMLFPKEISSQTGTDRESGSASATDSVTVVESETDSETESETDSETEPETESETESLPPEDGFLAAGGFVTVTEVYTLNVRSSPDFGADNVIGHISRGVLVPRTGYNDTWCRILYNGKTAYVSAKYVRVISPGDETDTGTQTETESATDSGDFGQTEYHPDSWKNTVVDTQKTEYSYPEMVEDLRILAARYPEFFRYESIGTSLDGRTIYAATLGTPDAPKQLLVTAGIHAREYVTCLTVMSQAEFYLDNYRVGSFGDRSFSELFSECALVIVPMVNPDGVMLAEQGISSVVHDEVRAMLLSAYESDDKYGLTAGSSGMDGYFRTWKANLAGVDLNRNFNTPDWASYGKMLAPSMQNFKGYAPESEPETRALIRLTESLSNPVASICMHSQGEVIYWNCGQTGSLAADSLALSRLASEENGYRIIMSENRDASFSDWCVLNKKIPAITVEIGDGGGSSLVPSSQIPVIFSKNRDLWAASALYFLS